MDTILLFQDSAEFVYTRFFPSEADEEEEVNGFQEVQDSQTGDRPLTPGAEAETPEPTVIGHLMSYC